MQNIDCFTLFSTRCIIATLHIYCHCKYGHTHTHVFLTILSFNMTTFCATLLNVLKYTHYLTTLLAARLFSYHFYTFIFTANFVGHAKLKCYTQYVSPCFRRTLCKCYHYYTSDPLLQFYDALRAHFPRQFVYTSSLNFKMCTPPPDLQF